MTKQLDTILLPFSISRKQGRKLQRKTIKAFCDEIFARTKKFVPGPFPLASAIDDVCREIGL